MTARVDRRALRKLLIERAASETVITYGEVAEQFGFPWTQGFASSLNSALNALGSDNRRKGEPLLMCLVVNKKTRRPGPGYYAQLAMLGDGGEPALFTAAQAEKHFLNEVRQCRRWPWTSESLLLAGAFKER
jgi:hypothetical protein